MENKSRCLAAWLNSFSGEACEGIHAYADGSVLFSVAQDVIPSFDYSGVVSDISSVIKALEHAYGREWHGVDGVLAATHAQEEAGLSHLVRVAGLLLAWTVQSEKREEYINKIMELNDDVQMVLMEMIEAVLEEVAAPGAASEEGGTEPAMVAVVPAASAAAAPPSPGAHYQGAFEPPRTINRSRVRASLSRLSIGGSAAAAVEHSAAAAAAVAATHIHTTAEASSAAVQEATATVSVPQVVAAAAAPSVGGRGVRELEQANSVLKEQVEDLREEVERYKRKLAAASHGGSGSGGPVVAVGVGPRRSVIGGGGRPSVLPPRPRTSLSGNIDFLQLLAQPGGGEGGEGSGDEDSGMSKGASRIAALEAKLAESESSNKSLLARLAKATAEAEAASRLRDELDVLRPLAAAKDKAEAAAERLKKKVDGIPELKAQIKRLEDKNQELVSQVLSLEREVAQIPPLRDTLEAAQDAKCASDIRCSELEAALAEAQATCEELRSALSTASDSNHAGASTDWAPASIGSAQLAELLQQQPADAASEAGAGSGSTTGMNEFNPELAEKMARLERENADLKACVSGGSGERVTKLERDLEDLRRMKVAFEGKFHQSKTKAAELEKQLADANAQIAQLQSELAARNTELTNGKREQAELEESLTALQRGAQQLKAQLASVKTAHADDKQTWTTQRDQLTTQLERERAAHSATQQAHLAEVASMQGAHAAALQEAKDELQRRLQAVQAELARNNNAAEAALASKDADHSALMRSVERRHADAVSRLEDELQDIKRAADDRYRQLSQSSAEREASLQRELDAYREAHSVSDKEYLGKIATLQEQAASLQSKITTLEALKEKGTMYVQQLQLEIQDKVAALEEQAAVACDQQAAAEEYAARYADALRRLEMEEDSCRTLRMEYDELQAMLKKTRKEARSRQDGDLELATVCKGLETEGALPAGFGETGTAASAGATAAEEGASAATGTRRGGARRVKAAATIDHERSIAEQLVHLESQLLQLQEERNKALANQSEALRQRNDMESERDDLADKIEKLEAECTRCKLTAQRLALRLESLGDSLPAEMGGEERTVLVVGGGAGENTEELPAAYGAHGSGDGDEEDDDEFTANAADFFSQQSKPTTAPAFAHAAEVLASSGVRAASTALAPKQSTAAVGVGPRMSIANSKMWEKAAAAARVPRSGAGGVSGGTGL